tara:strand:- start:78 stop:257 length:180 start_codon:yes stop_codon:yes gene_type:complete
MKNKKQYTFTLNEKLINWFRIYADEEDRSMSSIINSYILELKRLNETKSPTGNILRVKD